jgi:hypothetical protein
LGPEIGRETGATAESYTRKRKGFLGEMVQIGGKRGQGDANRMNPFEPFVV